MILCWFVSMVAWMMGLKNEDKHIICVKRKMQFGIGRLFFLPDDCCLFLIIL